MLCRGESGAGDDDAWVDLGERSEDEQSLGHAWMWDDETRLADGVIFNEEQVEIDGPWPPALGSGAFSAEGSLDREQLDQELSWGESGSEPGDSVEVGPLPGRADGWGLDDG